MFRAQGLGLVLKVQGLGPRKEHIFSRLTLQNSSAQWAYFVLRVGFRFFAWGYRCSSMRTHGPKP